MPNTYQLHKQLHQLVQEKAKKHGLELKIESDYCYYKNDDGQIVFGHGKLADTISNEWGSCQYKFLCPAIQAEQIRQILWTFRDVFGKNPEYTLEEKELELEYSGQQNAILSRIAKSRAKALDDKWLGASEDERGNYQLPLFAREPETVLSEFIQILESI